MKYKSYTVLQLAAETGIRRQIIEQKKKSRFLSNLEYKVRSLSSTRFFFFCICPAEGKLLLLLKKIK